ncbi:DnaJ chaperone protein [Fadolivirus algeromassiliense]|jgi:hypothetical protein|uniref:DnaJ chaperone protein n=1 Tax=Fadolivirus FV1/VV64 TaxID=3070911 RepID=A0A7D3QU05_9VIRU|nr:DnaJ chaperone protein [Fadolivirus algeromassiliense]QKF93767.1 DnaJ chaperone protein [Fadolivirus FV1/VV64]
MDTDIQQILVNINKIQTQRKIIQQISFNTSQSSLSPEQEQKLYDIFKEYTAVLIEYLDTIGKYLNDMSNKEKKDEIKEFDEFNMAILTKYKGLKHDEAITNREKNKIINRYEWFYRQLENYNREYLDKFGILPYLKKKISKVSSKIKEFINSIQDSNLKYDDLIIKLTDNLNIIKDIIYKLNLIKTMYQNSKYLKEYVQQVKDCLEIPIYKDSLIDSIDKVNQFIKEIDSMELMKYGNNINKFNEYFEQYGTKFTEIYETIKNTPNKNSNQKEYNEYIESILENIVYHSYIMSKIYSDEFPNEMKELISELKEHLIKTVKNHLETLGCDSSDSLSTLNKCYELGINLYTILGLKDYASIDEIKKAYRRLGLKLHPDKCKLAGNEKICESCFKLCNFAHDYLTNEDDISIMITDPTWKHYFNTYGRTFKKIYDGWLRAWHTAYLFPKTHEYFMSLCSTK